MLASRGCGNEKKQLGAAVVSWTPSAASERLVGRRPRDRTFHDEHAVVVTRARQRLQRVANADARLELRRGVARVLRV